VVLVLSLLGLGSSQQGLSRRRQAEQEVLQRIFRADVYDKDVSPGGNDTGGPTNVTVNLYVRDIMKVDENKMEMVLQLTLRQQWRDSRLAFSDRRIGPEGGENTTYIVVTDVKRLWRPDLFIANDVESRRHDFSVTNAFTRIYPDGNVLSSERVTVRARCPMDLKSFPFDTQTCNLRMASYGHTERDVVFTWKKEDPVQISSRITMPRYELSGYSTDYCNSRTNTGVYSCIRVDFTLVRDRNYWFLQVFIPCTMMVIISYLAFWLEPQNVVARLLIGLSSLLVMALQTSRLNERLPEVAYAKALDLFTGLSLTFAFVALLESVIVNFMSRREREEGQCKDPAEDGGAGTEDPEAEALKPESESKQGGETKKRSIKLFEQRGKIFKKLLPKARGSTRVDGIARLAFPLVFLLFLIVYFGVHSA
jgi:cation transporter family protein